MELPHGVLACSSSSLILCKEIDPLEVNSLLADFTLSAFVIQVYGAATAEGQNVSTSQTLGGETPCPVG